MKCPKCQSADIEKVGMGHKVGAGDPKTGAFVGGPFKMQHRCRGCEHVFWVAEPSK